MKLKRYILILFTVLILIETIFLCKLGYLFSILIILPVPILFIINELSYFDMITNSYNYESFKRKYKKMNCKKTLVYLDIDNFNLINSLYGKKVSVRLLNEIFWIIESNNDEGITARKSEDHFIMCFKTNKKIFEKISKIYDEIQKINVDGSIILHAKFGIAYCDDLEYDENEGRAYFAWQKAKFNSNSYYEIFNNDDLYYKIDNKKKYDTLLKIIKNDDISIYFQPLYEVKTKNIIGSEALVRFKENEKLLNTSEYINIAERYGLITEIDKIVLNKVCMLINDLKQKSVNFGKISINVSREMLSNEKMIKYYEDTLKKYSISKEEVIFEVTERYCKHQDDFLKILQKVSKKFSISLDDFGVEFSSLSILNNVDINTIKIDKSFIKNDSEKGKKVLEYVVSLSNELGINTLAEGIETEEELKYLKKIKCNYAQGYYLSKPLPYEKYIELFKGEK